MDKVFRAYERVKEQYPTYLIFFRLGDFYETFDIVPVAAIFDLPTTPHGSVCIPFHSAESYFLRLVELGHTIAISENVP